MSTNANTTTNAVTRTFGAPRDPPAKALFFVMAAALLGHTLALSNGHQDPEAMIWLTRALAVTVLAVLVPHFVAPRYWEQLTIGFIALTLAYEFAMLAHNAPGIYLQPRTGWERLWFLGGLSSAAVLAGAGLSEKPFLGRARMPLLLIISFLLGRWLIQASPSPVIDVDLIQRESVKALLSLHDPYELTFQNIYGSTAFFGNAIADAQRINVGFPYPPLSLILAVPGQVLMGDYRYSQLAAMVGAGALMAYAHPGREPGKISSGIAAVYLFTPRTFFVLEQGWTDPFLVLLAAATVFTALRVPKIMPWIFGLLIVVKQYAALAVAFSWLLVRPFNWRTFGKNALKAAGIALLVTLPFVLWNPSAFFFSVGGAHGGTPFRPDALSFPAEAARLHGGVTDNRWGNSSTIAMIVAFVLATWRTPRTPSGFAGALALIYFAFFAFSGHAFCNHYYFILGLLCVAGAAAGAEAKETTPP